MDAWLLLLQRYGVPTQSFALIGRWIGHLRRGQWRHDSIAKAVPICGELWIGWCAHYAVGIAFAALLVAWCGLDWVRAPSLLPALLTGVGTVAAPLLVLQPAFGAGIASTRTKTPLLNGAKSLATHSVFGAGLYLAAQAAACLVPLSH
jgi:hypothetical protein